MGLKRHKGSTETVLLHYTAALYCCRTSVPYALLNASVAVSQMITAPVAAGLLQLDGVAGLAGWQ